MRKIIFLTLMTFVLLNLTAMVANAEVEHDKDIINVINEFIPSNSSLISPEHPVSTRPFQLYDFNHDGNDEVIINYKLKAKEQPSPSQFGAIV
jgi:bla regulator protein BlaR1